MRFFRRFVPERRTSAGVSYWYKAEKLIFARDNFGSAFMMIRNAKDGLKTGSFHGMCSRLLDPHYGSKLPRIAQAIQLLGRRLVIGLDAAK